MKKLTKIWSIWLAIMLMPSTQLFAQQYLWPLKLEPDISSRFGDCRSGHWHSGIDCRTQGQTGFRVYAIESGYIFKVRTGYWGYGKSLYLKLNDGNLIVFGHLQGFTPEIDRFVYNQQMNQKKYYQEIEFTPTQFPVRKGDVIAISGQTGVGFPHLHMEIRDKDNIPINPQKSFYHLNDNSSPIIVRLAVKRFIDYGINNYHDMEFLNIVGRGGDYQVTDTVAIYGQAAFSINAYDQGSGFSYGIYRGSLSIDGDEIFAFARDSLNYLTGSQISYVNDNELQSLAGDQGNSDDDRATFYRLHCQPYDIQTFYGTYRFPDGIIDSDNLDSDVHKIQILLSDVNGNASKLRLFIKKASLPKPGFRQFGKYPKESNIMIGDTPDGTRFETQICRKAIAGYKNLICRFDKTRNTLILPPIGMAKNIRFRSKNSAGEFSPWVVIDPDLKKQRIVQYADYWNLINIQDKSEQPYIDLLNNIIDRNTIDLDTWQGLADIRDRDRVVFFRNPSTDYDQSTYFCGSDMTSFSPDSLVTLEIGKKLLFGKTVVTISAMHNRNEITHSFEIGPSDLLFNGQAKLIVKTDGLVIDSKSISLYVKWGSRWYYKAGIANNLASCTISGGGEFAFLSDNKPPTISGLTPANGATLRNSRPIVSCKVSDNLSGISRETQFSMMIDNNWVPADYDITTGILSYQINQPLNKGAHEAIIKIIDNQGNLATAVTKFKILGKY
jgi:hypothetical protein